MSTRAGEWQLLDHDSDPVPGDPAAVGDEAQDYARVASTISAQARRLRSLAEPDAALKGYYADALQDGMNDLADDLDKMHGRFETAGSQLTVLEPALDTARTRTQAALDAAVDAKARVDANQPGDSPAPGSPEPTDAEADAKRDRSRRRGEGETALADARASCRNAMEEFDAVAESVAGAIRSAADDDMKDSRWDKFKSFVDAHVDVIRTLVKYIGYVVIVLAIAAIFVTGLGPLIAALLVLSLALNLALASTGNGSWTAVAFDVVGLLTLGIGSGALRIARAGRAATLARAARPAARAARADAFRRVAWNGGRGLRGFASRLRPSVMAARSGAYADEFARITSRPLRELPRGLRNLPEGIRRATPRSVLRSGGSAEVREVMDDMAGIVGDFPGVSAAIRYTTGTGAAGVTSVFSMGATAFQKVAGSR